MTESVYKVIELIGTSKDSWEKAAAAAVERAGKTLRDLRVAEVVKLDLQLDAKGRSKPTAPSSTSRLNSRALEASELNG
jgi:flavin-binding protein dodecin